MQPVIRTSQRKDPTGLLNKLVVTSNEITPVYNLAPTSEFSTVTISVMNTTNAVTAISIWVAPTGKTPQLVDLIEPLITLQPNQVFIRTGLILSYKEAIYLRTSQPQLVVRVEGYENVIL